MKQQATLKGLDGPNSINGQVNEVLKRQRER